MPLPQAQTSLAPTGTAAAAGTPPQQTPVPPASQAHSSSRKGCSQGSWTQMCLPWPGHCHPGGCWGCRGMVRPSPWSLLAGEALACSNELHLFSLHSLHPAAFKGCSDGVGSAVCCLSPSSVPSPQPWSSAQHGGTRGQAVAKPAHCSHPPQSSGFRAQPSSHGWAEPFPSWSVV